MPLQLATAWSAVLYLVVIVLPGAAAARLLRLRFDDPGVFLGASIGLGLALLPLAYLWLDTLGLRIGPVWWWAMIAVSAGIVALSSRQSPPRAQERTTPSDIAPGTGGRDWSWAHAGLATVFVVVLASRWWAARDLLVPRWGDSVHHTIMVELMLRDGGLPADWRPFAELATFTYHFGLHAGVAALSDLASLPPHQALIIAGQMLSALGVVTAYALAAQLSGSRWAGAFAALAAGGLSPMPAYYLNWGRYTQLAGQVLLPAAAALTVAAALAVAAAVSVASRRRESAGRAATTETSTFEARGVGSRFPLKAILAAGIAVAGLALTHYVVTVFFAVFCAAWWLIAALSRRPGPDDVAVGPVPGDVSVGTVRGGVVSIGAVLGAVAMTAFLLASPWIPRFLAGPLDDYAVGLSTQPVDPGVFGVTDPGLVWRDFALHIGWPLAAATLIGLAAAAATYRVAIVRGQRASGGRAVAVGALWTVLLIAGSNPRVFGLPVVGVLKDFTVNVGLYLPLSLVVAGIGVIVSDGRRGSTRLPLAAYAGLAVAAVLFGLRDANVLIPETELVTGNDLALFEWIEANTPDDAVFLASSFSAFGDTVIAGDDAGWWLPYFTHRSSVLPPIVTGTERSFEPGYREQLNELSLQWHEDLDSAATVALLDATGADWAFVGEVAVRNDERGTGQGLAPRLEASPSWDRVHAVGAAAVYRRVARP